MDYELEELLPLVSRLAEKYTGLASTSISYEKAEQLIEAILYCVEAVRWPDHESAVSAGKLPVRQAYEIGLAHVEEKAKTALALYQEMLPRFTDYGSRCLYDVFIEGMPEFFKWYDVKFHPQDTILTLDYPVLKDLSSYSGIRKIYEYLRCLSWEQDFLAGFPEDYVLDVLQTSNRDYQDSMENLCQILFSVVIKHILASKPLSERIWEERDLLSVKRMFEENDAMEIQHHLRRGVGSFLEQHYENGGELFTYLAESMGDILVRLKVAAANNPVLV